MAPLTAWTGRFLKFVMRATHLLEGYSMTDQKSQLEKFKEAARELETDDDPERFKDRLAKVVKHKPVEKPE